MADLFIHGVVAVNARWISFFPKGEMSCYLLLRSARVGKEGGDRRNSYHISITWTVNTRTRENRFYRRCH